MCDFHELWDRDGVSQKQDRDLFIKMSFVI